MKNKEWKAHHKDALAERFNELPEYDHLKDHADYKNYDKITRLTIVKNIRRIVKKGEKDLNLFISSASNIV
tara:strand:- start:370 stop:582 length:213 start_codon:yes stop_codon:yes gene_type:complete